MMYLGKTMSWSCPCGTCGQAMSNSLKPDSAFILGACQNKDCDDWGKMVLIEKKSMQVIFMYGYKVDGEDAWPMLANQKGEQVWPKPTPEIFEKSSEG